MDELSTLTQKIISYLTFRLGDEYFALNVGKVLNILEMQKITRVPKAPEYMAGIINLRGEVLPVIDTNLKLGMGKTVITDNTCILVIELIVDDDHVKFGILVDAVQEVLQLDDADISDSPSISTQYQAEIITGVVEKEDRFVMVLDINKLLEMQEVETINSINAQNN